MKKCIVNFEDQQVVQELENFGFSCVPVIHSDRVSTAISCHADVLYNKIENDTILVSGCQRANFGHLNEYNVILVENLKPGYKTECLLNFIINDKFLIRNQETAIMLNTDKAEINTKQGYTKCSCLCLNSNSYITGDRGLYKTLIKQNLNCLLIDDSEILLDGYDHGFIGGASLKLNEREILFFGEFGNKETEKNVISFIENQNMICHFIKGKRLVDIGSAIII